VGPSKGILGDQLDLVPLSAEDLYCCEWHLMKGLKPTSGQTDTPEITQHCSNTSIHLNGSSVNIGS